MRTGIRAIVAVAIAAFVLTAVGMGQTATPEAKQPPDSRRSCSTSFGLGRRIASNLDIVEFRVPRFAHTIRVVDADYVRYSVRYGPKASAQWLGFWVGFQVGGQSPHELQNGSIQWADTTWSCSGIEITDWRGTAKDGRCWRHIALPLSGFAAYEGVPRRLRSSSTRSSIRCAAESACSANETACATPHEIRPSSDYRRSRSGRLQRRPYSPLIGRSVKRRFESPLLW